MDTEGRVHCYISLHLWSNPAHMHLIGILLHDKAFRFKTTLLPLLSNKTCEIIIICRPNTVKLTSETHVFCMTSIFKVNLCAYVYTCLQKCLHVHTGSTWVDTEFWINGDNVCESYLGQPHHGHTY